MTVPQGTEFFFRCRQVSFYTSTWSLDPRDSGSSEL